MAKVEPSLAQPAPNDSVKSETAFDVPRFVGKFADELEKVLGKPVEVKTLAAKKNQNPSEYRLYRLPNHPQGLSIHFYDGKATVFNLVLSKAAESPRDALFRYFAIDVKDATPIKKDQFLEKWQGKFNGVDFTSVYAMKERIENKDYKLLHAEVAK